MSRRDDHADVCPPREPRFQLLTGDQLLSLPPPEWLVDGVLPGTGLGTLIGAPGSGKSFAALDMAISVASGEPWLSTYRTRQGPVVYLAAEGGYGQTLRFRAWLQERRVGRVDGIRFVLARIDLMLNGDVDELAAAIDATGIRPRLLIFDTLARCMAGNENAGEDIGAVIRACDQLRDRYGCAVLLVHHTGHEGTRARGHSSLFGAIDTEMFVEAVHRARRIICRKQKDWAPFEPIGFHLRQVDLDDQRSSCVVERVDGGVHLSATDKKALVWIRAQDRPARHRDWLGGSGLQKATFNRSLKRLVSLTLVRPVGRLYEAVHDETAG